MMIFLHVTCSLVDLHQCSGGWYCVPLQCWRVSTTRRHNPEGHNLLIHPHDLKYVNEFWSRSWCYCN